MVLQVLYENIKDKSKLLKNTRVTKVEMGSDSVTAIAADGTKYTGDILVGADGIHSQVRQEMWRIADEISPGYIPSSEKQREFRPYNKTNHICHALMLYSSLVPLQLHIRDFKPSSRN
jgi:2-polyprenyl-6-methoxyphenol hydroxylase-like FAD-dependent oxidoreductase